jgi:predicted dehydrogenase
LADTRLLIVGLGSIGRRHLRVLRELPCVEVAVCRRNMADAEQTQRDDGVPAFANLEAALAWRPDAVLVTGPTHTHEPVARQAIEAGCHVFVEKPLACRTNGAREWLDAARQRGLVVAVGCNLRFHPALQCIRSAVQSGQIGRLLSVRAEVGQYLPDWHPQEDYRHGYAAQARQGGGVLLTLIHEVDYVLWIAGDARTVTAVAGHVSSLELDGVEDLAEIIVVHAGGNVSSIHLDFLDRAYQRRSRWVGESGSIEWTWGQPVYLSLPGREAHTLWQDSHFSLEQTYRAELLDFVESIRNASPPAVDGWEALRALAVVEHARLSSRTGRRQVLIPEESLGR